MGNKNSRNNKIESVLHIAGNKHRVEFCNILQRIITTQVLHVINIIRLSRKLSLHILEIIRRARVN